MNNVVIADTSCLIALDKINHLHILKHLFDSINITTQINVEFGLPLPDWFIVHNVVSLQKLDFLLDAGEASALTLALSFNNSLVIIDEKKGRKIAQELHINIVGTLKLLLIAKQNGVIKAIKPLIELLEHHSFRFNKAIVNQLLIIAQEI